MINDDFLENHLGPPRGVCVRSATKPNELLMVLHLSFRFASPVVDNFLKCSCNVICRDLCSGGGLRREGPVRGVARHRRWDRRPREGVADAEAGAVGDGLPSDQDGADGQGLWPKA